MKKNVMMRAASALLVAVLLTTCAISGTFAKYTTEATVTDSARVAYWGFQNDTALTFDLFKNDYDGTVKGNGTDKVVAPGTANTVDFSFAFKANAASSVNAPEVKYTLKVTPTITGSYAALDANPNFKWTLKPAGATDATEYGTVEELRTAIMDLAGTGNTNGEKTYEAGNAPTALNGTCTIGWKWDFPTTANEDQDVTDTAMGNAATLNNISITIAIEATQID